MGKGDGTFAGKTKKTANHDKCNHLKRQRCRWRWKSVNRNDNNRHTIPTPLPQTHRYLFLVLMPNIYLNIM